MKKIRFLLFFLALVVSLSSCDSGYKIEGGKIYYISYNEAQGRVNRDFGADAKSFKVLEIENYAVDANHVFYCGNIIEGADPRTFEPLSEYIGKDAKHGYISNKVIPNSDGKTFQLIDDNYTRDKNDVYYMEYPLYSSSPKTFEILEIGHGNYSRDGHDYWYWEKKIPIKDYDTFKILDGDCMFAKDKFQVYEQDRIIKELDAATFQFLEPCVGRDKSGCHNGDERCGCPNKH